MCFFTGVDLNAYPLFRVNQGYKVLGVRTSKVGNSHLAWKDFPRSWLLDNLVITSEADKEMGRS